MTKNQDLLTRFVLVLGFFYVACMQTANAQNTINVPADQPTIQAAITLAQSGDTVLVAPGTYLENNDFLGKAITVTSSEDRPPPSWMAAATGRWRLSRRTRVPAPCSTVSRCGTESLHKYFPFWGLAGEAS